MEEAVDSDQLVQGKCTKQHALIANRKPRYHSFLQQTDLCIAGTATRSTSHRDTKSL